MLSRQVEEKSSLCVVGVLGSDRSRLGRNRDTLGALETHPVWHSGAGDALAVALSGGVFSSLRTVVSWRALFVYILLAVVFLLVLLVNQRALRSDEDDELERIRHIACAADVAEKHSDLAAGLYVLLQSANMLGIQKEPEVSSGSGKSLFTQARLVRKALESGVGVNETFKEFENAWIELLPFANLGIIYAADIDRHRKGSEAIFWVATSSRTARRTRVSIRAGNGLRHEELRDAEFKIDTLWVCSLSDDHRRYHSVEISIRSESSSLLDSPSNREYRVLVPCGSMH